MSSRKLAPLSEPASLAALTVRDHPMQNELTTPPLPGVVLPGKPAGVAVGSKLPGVSSISFWKTGGIFVVRTGAESAVEDA